MRKVKTTVTIRFARRTPDKLLALVERWNPAEVRYYRGGEMYCAEFRFEL